MIQSKDVFFVSSAKMLDFISIILHSDRNIAFSTIKRRCCAVFGASPKSCVSIWLLLYQARSKHLLWILVFLKMNETENALAALLQTDEKTIRKWKNIFVAALSNLNLVRFFIFYFYFRS